MSAFATPEQFALANQANLDSALSLISSAFNKTERLTALNISTARSVLSDSVAASSALLEVKDPKQLAQLQSSLAQPLVEKATAYVRGVYEIAAQSQEEVAKLVDAQNVELNKNFASALAQVAKAAPAGSGVVIDALKSTIVAINSAYESTAKAAQQAAKIAEANVVAATEAALKAAGSLKA